MREVLHDLLERDLTSGELLRGARVELGISQEEMEIITGIKRSNISALENDRIRMTSHYAEIFSVALGLHPADLLYPNRKVVKSEELLEIEKRARAFLKKQAKSS